jgi:hypothetical protein
MAQRHPPLPVHVPGTLKGEELVIHKGREPGRAEDNEHPPYRQARDATGINAGKRRPIEPRMVEMPPA